MNFIEKALTKVFGSANERLLKQLWPIVAEINAIEPTLQSLSDDELRAKTAELQGRAWLPILRQADPDDSPGRRKLEQELLDKLLPEAFACVREASRRATGMRHFDVQLIGGMVLNRGNDRRDANR
jgi:preprotein translocase subunit SecA